MLEFKCSRSLWNCHHFSSFFFLYSVLQQCFPPSYLPLTYPFFCLSYSAINSFWCIPFFFSFGAHHCLFISSCRSLLNISCNFSTDWGTLARSGGRAGRWQGLGQECFLWEEPLLEPAEAGAGAWRELVTVTSPFEHHSTMLTHCYGHPGFFEEHSSLPYPQAISAQPTAVLSLGPLS